jgi:hypothetical protein
VLPCVESNRKVTYVLVFVEDVECFDGRHVVVECPSLCLLVECTGQNSH